MAAQQNKARGRIFAEIPNLSLRKKPAIQMKAKTRRKITAGLATESEPSNFFTNGILVRGSDATKKYQVILLQS